MEDVWGDEERDSDRRPAESADQARSNAPGLGSLVGPVVGEPARLLLEEREVLLVVGGPEEEEESDVPVGFGVEEGDILAGGSQTGRNEEDTGIVIRA